MTICESIKKRYIRLSKGQRKVAQYVIDNPNVVATQVASEVGRLAGVSESTVIRFCYAMSLSGYSELQEKMKAYILEKDGVIPVLPKSKVATDEQQVIQLDDILSKDMKELLTILQQVNVQQYNDVFQVLHEAKDVYVVGLDEALPIAFSVYYDLKKVRGNVHIVQNDATKTAEQLLHMDHTSAVVAISLEGQQNDLLSMMETMKRKNVSVITVTSQSAPKLKKYSSKYFDLNKHGKLEDGTVAMYALLRAIVKCFVKQYEEVYSSKLSEEKHSPNKLLIEVS